MILNEIKHFVKEAMARMRYISTNAGHSSCDTMIYEGTIGFTSLHCIQKGHIPEEPCQASCSTFPISHYTLMVIQEIGNRFYLFILGEKKNILTRTVTVGNVFFSLAQIN